MKQLFSRLPWRALGLAVVAMAGAGLGSAQGANYALHFDGVNDYVTCGRASLLSVSNFTVETWFRWDGGGQTTNSGVGGVANAIPLVAKGRGDGDGTNKDVNYFLAIRASDRVLAADLEEYGSGANHPVAGSTAITSNTWHHAAVTYDGNSWCLYLDGNVENTLYVGVPPRYDSIEHLGMASALTSTGVPGGFFQGTLDEVRIWDTARSGAEIRSGMNQEIQSASHLLARWGCNEGSGLTVTNSVATTNTTGTLAGGPIWTNGAPFNLNIPPETPELVGPTNGATCQRLGTQLLVNVSDLNPADTLTTVFYARPAVPDFTVVMLPDTQNYLTNGGTFLSNFLNEIQWITNNRDASNIAFVAHMGDVVETDSSVTQWQNATSAMYRLDPFNIPYGLAVGNHDQSPKGADGASTNYNTYFGTNHFQGRPGYGGHYGTNNDNHFALFESGGLKFIAIFIEFNSAATTNFSNEVSWARSVLETNMDRGAIIVSHGIINASDAWVEAGQSLYNAFTNRNNVFLMLCGHESGDGWRTEQGSGHRVDIVLADYQSYTNGGDGCIKTLRFSPMNDRIYVRRYNTTRGIFETGGSDKAFEIPYIMVPYEPIGTNSTPNPGQAGVLWAGLAPGASYQWYASVSDGISTTVGPAWSFTTADLPTVTVVADDSTAREPDSGIDNGSFLITRSSECLNDPLTVYYTLGGTATPGSDYESPPACMFLRGDANGDGTLDISDSIAIDSFLRHEGTPVNVIACDVDDDNDVDAADSEYILEFLFHGGPAPKPPYPSPGLDPNYSVFIRGDADNNGLINTNDSLYIINYWFSGGPAPCVLEAADVDGDGDIDITDAIYLNTYLQGGNPPPAPFPDPGFVPSQLLAVTIPAGQASVALPITVLDDSIYEGDETVILNLWTNSSDYVTGSPSSATVNIISIIDLGVLPGYADSYGFGINSNGTIVGTSGGRAFRDPSPPLGAGDDLHQPLSQLYGTPGTSAAYDICDSDKVVGDYVAGGYSRAWYRGYYYGSPSYQNLAAPSAYENHIRGIGDWSGGAEAAGFSYVSGYQRFCHWFIYDNYPGYTYVYNIGLSTWPYYDSYAYAVINSKVVGYFSDGANNQAVIWDWSYSGATYLPPAEYDTSTAAYDITYSSPYNSYYIAGETGNGSFKSACYWNYSGPNSPYITKVYNPDSWNSVARGINPSLKVVGACHSSYFPMPTDQWAALWDAGTFIDLYALGTASGWSLHSAEKINAQGQITGYGTINNQVHAFTMRP